MAVGGKGGGGRELSWEALMNAVGVDIAENHK